MSMVRRIIYLRISDYLHKNAFQQSKFQYFLLIALRLIIDLSGLSVFLTILTLHTDEDISLHIALHKHYTIHTQSIELDTFGFNISTLQSALSTRPGCTIGDMGGGRPTRPPPNSYCNLFTFKGTIVYFYDFWVNGKLSNKNAF